MKNQKIILSVLLGTHLLLAQKTIVKDDFAFGRELEIPTEKSVVDVLIPGDVYLTSKQANLADVGVFNAKGELVPHVLLESEVKILEKAKPSLSLTLFPIYSSAATGPDQFSHIKVSTSSEGTITEIKQESGGNDQASDAKKLIGYLVDASKVKDTITALQMNLGNVEESVFVNFIVEGSQDLNSWTLLDDSSILAKFEVNGEKIVKDKIELNRGRYNYFRLSWKNDGL